MKLVSLLKGIALWEGGWWLFRRHQRNAVFEEAQARARELGLPLVVIGAPDHWVTAGYPCGDITVDIESTSTCPNFISADITKQIPMADNSGVVFVSCTLEYVDDVEAAMRELRRVSGGELYGVRVEPWTLTSILFPGTKRQLPWPTGKYPSTTPFGRR